MTYKIRPCQRLDELASCVELQKTIWGYADHEAYPLRLFVNLSKIGGHVLGAFSPEGQLAGFVAAMPAWRGARRYYHSLSLGVRSEHENRGVGRSLKLAQRRLALRGDVGLIQWTFDPLRAKNAFFNVVRLGAIARRYLADYYGPVESRLQLGLPTDRLIAEWWVKSPRVQRALSGKVPRATRKAPAAEVSIPDDIDALARAQPELARQAQAAVRKQLEEYFASRLVITGFARDAHPMRYQLDPASVAGVARLT